jgi:lysophospholipase L1-like esterase
MHCVRHITHFMILPLLTIVLFLGAFSGVASAHANHTKTFAKTYLALGDSLAFGYQGYKDGHLQQPPQPFDPNAFTTGYDRDFLALLQQVKPTIQEVNYACPGETTSTFIHGDCLYHNTLNPFPLHNNYPITESQLQVAVEFLFKHRDQVSPITFNLGSNDENVLIDQCKVQADPAPCIAQGFPTVLQTAKANFTTILRALRFAAPHSKILVIQTPQAMQLIPGVEALADQMNATIQAAAQSIHATVVDAHSGFTQASLCQLTLYCITNGADFHPSDAGYTYIATQVWSAFAL